MAAPIYQCDTTLPQAAVVRAVGESGPAGSFNPLVLQNG
jgi:hypothetical protein